MNKQKSLPDIVYKTLFIIAISLIIYMPLHVFIAQSASLLTGGLDAWKALKDIILVVLVPVLLFIAYKQGLFRNKTFRWLMVLGAIYALLHLYFVVFDKNDDTYSTIVASVYNTRILGYLLFGIVVGSLKNSKKYLKYILIATIIIATVVSILGVLQYFLPKDILTHVGYSLDRGVKPMFFIDDRPELPRIMSTLKDPNSLGAYLIVPILLSGFAFLSKKARKNLFDNFFSKGVLGLMLAIQIMALFLTFSRGALLGFLLSIVTILCIVTGERAVSFVRKYLIFFTILSALLGFLVVQTRNTNFVQDYIIHAAISTNEADPNEKRVGLAQQAVDEIVDEPEGHGPGSAGLVSITNPKGGVLTENYYLQIAYEVGWIGIGLFVAILSIVTVRLFRFSRKGSEMALVMLASLVAYLFYSLLIHLWSNEAVALQWWLLAGATLGLILAPKAKLAKD